MFLPLKSGSVLGVFSHEGPSASTTTILALIPHPADAKSRHRSETGTEWSEEAQKHHRYSDCTSCGEV